MYICIAPATPTTRPLLSAMHVTRSSRKRKRTVEDEPLERLEENLEEFRSSQEKMLSNGWEAFREEYTECEQSTTRGHHDLIEFHSC